MAQLNDTMVQGDLRVTGTVFGTTANIPDIYTNDKIAYGDATGQSLLIASRADGGLPNMNVYEATSLNGFVTPLTKYSKVSSDSYKCEFDSIIGGNDGTTDYPMWHHVTYAGTNSWTSSLTRLLTTTSSISSTDDLEPLLTASRGVVKSSSTGAFPTNATGTSPTGNILGFNCVSWASLGSNQYGIVFHGDNARTGLTYNNSYILGTNSSFTGVSDIGYDSTSHYFQGMSQSARKAKYAEMALSGGALDNALNDKMKKDASNATTGDGTGAAPTLLDGMTTGNGNITSDDVFIPTTNSGGGADGKWYKRKLSFLWPWIKSKLTGSDVNIGGNSASATRVNGYILNNSSGAEMYRVSLGYAAFDSNSMEANITALVSLEVASGAGGTGSGLAFIVKYNSRGTVRNVSTRLLVDNHYSTNNRPVVLTVTDNTNNRLYFYVANVNSSNALQRFDWSKIRVTPLTDVQNFTWSIAGDTSTSYTTMYKVDEIANAAKTIYDWHSGAYMKLYVGGLGSDPDTIYIQ